MAFIIQPQKRRREVDPCDQALITSLQEITAYAKERREKKATKINSPNVHFGMEVAERLDRLERNVKASLSAGDISALN